jgi:hypothetical protein
MSKYYKLISRQIKDIKVEDDKFIILVYSISMSILVI